MTTNTLDLYCDNILAKPVDRQWGGGYGEAWEVVLPDFESMEAEALFDFADDYGRSLADDPRELSRAELIAGLESIGCACYDEEGDDLLAAAYGDSMVAGDLYGCADEWPETCREAYEEGSSPMMNYAYPVELREISPGKAAEAIIGLPLTLVLDIESDEYFLALTGGGMDLSAEICRAYIALNQRPPVHFCNVPRMAGRHYSQDFIAVLIESCEVAQNWSQSTIDDLQRLAADPSYSEQEAKQA